MEDGNPTHREVGCSNQYSWLMRRSNQRRDAVFACYQQEVTDRPLSVLLAEAKPFTVELAEGVEAHREDLDEVISEYAQGWDLSRIAPLEKNIMRVALYEMNFRDDVPFEVAIDEAVETAKKFCGAEAPGFVNGILGAAARDMKADTEATNAGTETADTEATNTDTEEDSGEAVNTNTEAANGEAA